MNPTRGCVLCEADALAFVAGRRGNGERIVLTNGAFDLLHVGHVRMLEAAAALGDVLVVAVNDDAAVAASKGSGRPVVPAAERAELVAALPGVDVVFVVPDRTMHRVLETLRPHVHAKGREYEEATHPEAATNRALGIEMAFVGDRKTKGSRDLVIACSGTAAADVVVPYSGPSGERGYAVASAPRLPPEELPREPGVRRTAIDGAVLYVKTYAAKSKRGAPHASAVDEAKNLWAIRAAGLRAVEPVLAFEGRLGARRAGVVVTREAPGPGLDVFLRDRLPGASPRERLAWAAGLGRAVRAWHTARFAPPDLHAWHVFVDGSPAGGPRSLGLLDVARLDRPTSRVTPKDAAPGLAALALTLRPLTSARFRLAVLRAYLGGDLSEARRWLEAIQKRIRHVEKRGTFRRLAEAQAAR